MILAYLTGFFTPFAIYGIYKAYQKFIRPDDIKATLDRLEVEKEKIIHKAQNYVCDPVNRN